MIIKVIYLGIFDFIINGYLDLVICVLEMFSYVILVIVDSFSKKLMFILVEWVILVK